MQWKRFAGSLAAALALSVAARGAEAQVLNGLAAVVGSAVITADDVKSYSYRAIEAAAKRIRNDEEFAKRQAEIWKESLEQLIEHELILNDYKTAGYNIPEKFFDDIYESEIRQQYGDHVTFVTSLHKENRTEESFRKEIRDTFIIRQLTLKNVAEYLIISPKKIEQYYQENQAKFQVGDRAKIRVILIEKQRHGAAEAAQLAASARERAVKGEDFSKLADEFSDDARKNKGGDRGWVENKDSDLREELRKVVFASKAGDISPVIDTDGAVFLVKIEERESAHLRPLADTRIEIEQTLKARENERIRKRWIAKIRNKVLIKYF